jgi:hypothetical protein
MMSSVELCRDELKLARRLGRQLRIEHASPVEITETISEAFEHDELRSAAMREAFRQRIVRLRAIQREV